MDLPESAVYGGLAVLALPKVIDLLKWSLGRNLSHEDAAKASATAELKRLSDSLAVLDRAVASLQAAQDAHKTDHTRALGTIEGRLHQLDTRIAEQGKVYKEEIAEGFKRVEIELNRKLAQVVAPRRR